MKTHLKIKILELSEESRIIRREKHKWLEKRRRAKARHPDYVDKSWMWRSLHDHRVGTLRSESRACLLAYAILRDRTYEQVEGTAKTQPDWNRVWEKLKLSNRREHWDAGSYYYFTKEELLQKFEDFRASAKRREARAPVVETVVESLNY